MGVPSASEPLSSRPLGGGAIVVDYARIRRWVDASQTLMPLAPFLLVLLQGLGRLDAELEAEDVLAFPETNPLEAQQAALKRIENHTLSYLWVLGAYEIVRTVAQKSREHPVPWPAECHRELARLKADFERLRVPLAKLEPARRHKETDSGIAFPAIHRSKGFAWQVSRDVYISRKDLADALLSFLESLSAVARRDPRDPTAA